MKDNLPFEGKPCLGSDNMDITDPRATKLSMWFRVEALTHRLKDAESFIKEKEHYYCEDSWYSCPKAEGGCCNDGCGDECNCGAEAHNERVAEYWSEYGRLDT